MCKHNSPERKNFLETVGIECKELGINFLNQIAQKVNFHFINLQPIKQLEKIELNIVFPHSEKVWIFQGNPQRYDIMNALADEEIGDIMHWSVNQYRKEISKGDMGMIWMSGKEAGIYAITEIMNDPKMMTEPEAERKYWIDSANEEGERIRVRMKILKNLLHAPLTKEILKLNDLGNISILRQTRGTNFPVTQEEWIKIKELIQSGEQQIANRVDG